MQHAATGPAQFGFDLAREIPDFFQREIRQRGFHQQASPGSQIVIEVPQRGVPAVDIEQHVDRAQTGTVNPARSYAEVQESSIESAVGPTEPGPPRIR